MKDIIIIGVGGAFGSIMRYLISIVMDRYVGSDFPIGTLLVNLSGCFVIGLLYGIGTRYSWPSLEWRLFLITGLCGGYTTFSSFSLESINLFRQSHYSLFALYVLGSVILGLLCTILGIVLIMGITTMK